MTTMNMSENSVMIATAMFITLTCIPRSAAIVDGMFSIAWANRQKAQYAQDIAAEEPIVNNASGIRLSGLSGQGRHPLTSSYRSQAPYLASFCGPVHPRTDCRTTNVYWSQNSGPSSAHLDVFRWLVGH
jgi:hypothetical protein